MPVNTDQLSTLLGRIGLPHLVVAPGRPKVSTVAIASATPIIETVVPLSGLPRPFLLEAGLGDVRIVGVYLPADEMMKRFIGTK